MTSRIILPGPPRALCTCWSLSISALQDPVLAHPDLPLSLFLQSHLYTLATLSFLHSHSFCSMNGMNGLCPCSFLLACSLSFSPSHWPNVTISTPKKEQKQASKTSALMSVFLLLSIWQWKVPYCSLGLCVNGRQILILLRTVWQMQWLEHAGCKKSTLSLQKWSEAF